LGERIYDQSVHEYYIRFEELKSAAISFIVTLLMNDQRLYLRSVIMNRWEIESCRGDINVLFMIMRAIF
jgi:hypothetical protein